MKNEMLNTLKNRKRRNKMAHTPKPIRKLNKKAEKKDRQHLKKTGTSKADHKKMMKHLFGK
jgi:hypothetical protein